MQWRAMERLIFCILSQIISMNDIFALWFFYILTQWSPNFSPLPHYQN